MARGRGRAAGRKTVAVPAMEVRARSVCQSRTATCYGRSVPRKTPDATEIEFATLLTRRLDDFVDQGLEAYREGRRSDATAARLSKMARMLSRPSGLDEVALPGDLDPRRRLRSTRALAISLWCSSRRGEAGTSGSKPSLPGAQEIESMRTGAGLSGPEDAAAADGEATSFLRRIHPDYDRMIRELGDMRRDQTAGDDPRFLSLRFQAGEVAIEAGEMVITHNLWAVGTDPLEDELVASSSEILRETAFSLILIAGADHPDDQTALGIDGSALLPSEALESIETRWETGTL